MAMLIRPERAGFLTRLRARPAGILVAELYEHGAVWFEDPHPFPCACHQRLNVLRRGRLGAQLARVMFPAVGVAAQGEERRAGDDEIDAGVGEGEVGGVAADHEGAAGGRVHGLVSGCHGSGVPHAPRQLPQRVRCERRQPR